MEQENEGLCKVITDKEGIQLIQMPDGKIIPGLTDTQIEQSSKEAWAGRARAIITLRVELKTTEQ